MRIAPELKMLAAVGVLFLMVGVSDSVVLTKCELKRKLEAAAIAFPQGALNDTNANLLAKIVCHVQLTSGFNTSAVKQITNPSNCSSPHESEPHGSEPHGSEHGPRRVRAAKKGKGKGTLPSKPKPTPSREADSGEMHDDDVMKVWTLYGLFQLSDTVACNSTHNPTLNLCGMSCNKLTDDDISDDLACVQLLINKITSVITDPHVYGLIHKMISMIYQSECANVVASSFFLNC